MAMIWLAKCLAAAFGPGLGLSVELPGEVMNSWCFTLALCCIRALGQTLEVPPADYGSYGSYDSYGDDVG